MANILSLAMKVSADASGVIKNLTPAERALENLGKQADKTLQELNSFASGTSGAAEAAANNFKAQFDRLNASLQAGLNGEEYARQFAALQGQVRETAAAFQEGAKITEQNRTADERRGQELQRLSDLLELGAIDQETYNRAAAAASGANETAAQAERERAQSLAAASRIIQANLTPQERYDNQMQELSGHLREGRLTQEQFNRAADRAANELNGVGKQANKTDKELTQLNRSVDNLRRIEVGRLIIDGLQALSGVFTRVASQVTALVSNVNAGVDSLNDLSARTGIGVEALQGYSLAAKLAGVDTEAFGTAVQKLAVNIGKATPGDALDKALKGINLSLQELRALSPEQQFSEIGAAISELPTAADRAAAAVAIFGKQGAALAPLFREGAASIEELQARAERLGIIISETQVNNVADMNDAFDLVRATVDGIIGQVIGNLAPAVTAVTDQFLKFVEEWSGSQGEGGTGIANAITDVLLQGAEYFAGVFDSFMQNFGDIATSLAEVGQVFDVGGRLLVSGMEAFRAVFNSIQIGIDALLIGFGKVIEALGSYVSNDLEQFGAGLAAASEESSRKNAAEMEAAAANAANTFNSIFTGGGDAEAAGQGAGQQFVRGLRSEIENARLPEVQVQADLAAATADLDQFLSTAEGGTSAFLAQSQATLATFSQMAAEGQLTADQIEIMNGFMEQLNGELVKEKQNRQEATDTAQAQVDADRKRLDQLLQTNDEAARLEQDLLTVQREQARVSQELAAARQADNVAQADAAAARQAELDQLQAKLEEQQQALEQGFGQGFQAAFDAVGNTISGLRDKAVSLGSDASVAWATFSLGVSSLQQQVKDGLLTKEAYEAEVARRREIYDKEIADIERTGQERQRINEYVDQQIALQNFGGDQERLAASQRVLEIEKEIVRVQEELAEAREAGNKAEADAAAQRLGQLDQVKAKEEDIASGRGKQEEEIRKQQEAALQSYQQQQQQAQQQFAQQQQKIFEEQQKAAAAEAKRQEERLAKLNTLGDQTIGVQDVRTTQGANLVLDLAANAQDPALIQQRLQTKLLERIALGVGQAASNYFNQPVAIVGAARFN